MPVLVLEVNFFFKCCFPPFKCTLRGNDLKEKTDKKMLLANVAVLPLVATL